MDWDDVKVFDTVAQTKTLTAAARQLKVSVATVTRRIESLEKALAIRLVNRTPEGVVLTVDGAALVEQARDAAAAMESVRRRADALRSGEMHPIRISATEPIAAEVLAPALPALIARLPNARIELSVSTEIASLATRSVDIALRFARPSGNSLLVQRLPAFTLGLYATGEYLAGRSPETFDLRKARLLTYDESYGRIAEVSWIEDNGLCDASMIRTSSTRALLNATLAGAGVGLLPDIFARQHGSLQRIPAPRPLPDRTIWLMSQKDHQRSSNHRLVRGWIVQTLRDATLAA